MVLKIIVAWEDNKKIKEKMDLLIIVLTVNLNKLFQIKWFLY